MYTNLKCYFWLSLLSVLQTVHFWLANVFDRTVTNIFYCNNHCNVYPFVVFNTLCCFAHDSSLKFVMKGDFELLEQSIANMYVHIFWQQCSISATIKICCHQCVTKKKKNLIILPVF